MTSKGLKALIVTECKVSMLFVSTDHTYSTTATTVAFILAFTLRGINILLPR